MVSNRLKMTAAIVGALLLAASYLAIKQGTSDANAKQLLAQNLKTQAQVEAARVERVKQINNVNHAQCRSLQNLYAIIRTTITTSDRSLDKIAYYRAHPAEKAFVHEQNRKTLEMFRQPPCPRDVVLPVHPITIPTP